MQTIRRLCVFCGSRSGARDDYALAARRMARLLAAEKIGLVYGGGQLGLMGIAADAALEAGGEVIGVIPKALCLKEVAHEGLSDLRVVGSMHERKALLAELSDGFIALPGGLGTLEEILEVWTWAHLGIHRKPCALLNVAGYYDQFLSFIENVCREDFLRREYLSMLVVDTDPTALLGKIKAFKPLALPKFVDKKAI